MSITIFACERVSGHASCVECGARAETSCGFALGGSRKGETCSRALCARCSSALNEHCGPHARLRERRAMDQAPGGDR